MPLSIHTSEKKLILLGNKLLSHEPEPSIQIADGDNFLLCFDGSDTKKIKISENLVIRVTLPSFFPSESLVDINVGRKEAFTLFYPKKRLAQVLEFVSLLEANGIPVIMNKCTDTYIGSSYETDCMRLLNGGMIEYISQTQRHVFYPDDVKSVNVQSGLVYLCNKDGEQMTLDKSPMSVLVSKKKFKPVIDHFMKNLEAAGFAVVREKW